MYAVYLIPYRRGKTEAFYCGYTNNPVRRWSEHNKRGFLASRKKRAMCVISNHTTIKQAMREESRVKKLKRIDKIALYEGGNDIVAG
jgi:predicted GIY-YIG superfamily endonuclease